MDSVFVPLGTLALDEVVKGSELVDKSGSWIERDILDSTLSRDLSNRPGPWYQCYVVVVPSIGFLRQVLPLFSVEGRAHQVVVVLETTESSRPFVSGYPVHYGESLRIWALTGFPSVTAIGITSIGWLDIHSVVSALASQQGSSLPLGGLRLGIQDPAGIPWAAADPQSRWIPAGELSDEIEPVDSLDLVIGPATPSSPGTLRLLTAGAETRVTDLLPPVDPYLSSPIGFKVFPGYGEASLTALESGIVWRLESKATSIRLPWDVRTGVFSEVQIGQLRDFSMVRLLGLEALDDWVVAHFLAQLASAGIPVMFGKISRRAETLLGGSVMDGLKSFSTCGNSPSERESASIDTRRSALRAFLPRYVGTRLRKSAGIALLEEPSVSVLLATKRPAMVAHALSQISFQTHSRVETVLVLHGLDPQNPTITAAIAAFSRPLIVIRAPVEATLGDVLNLGLRRATGHYVAKMDDDDWYGAHHLEDLFLAREYSGATLVGAPVEFTYLAGPDITTRRAHAGEQYSHHVAGGTIFISRHDLQAVGGWRNTPSAVDRGLLDAVLASSGRVYRTHGQNYMMHRRTRNSGGQFHTWVADDSTFLQDIREQWNGFHPAPQLQLVAEAPSTYRSQTYKSWLSTHKPAPS